MAQLHLNPITVFVTSQRQIEALVAACFAAADRGEAIGLDTEFYGVEIGKQSTVARSKLHMLSIAVARPSGAINPHGVRYADSAVILKELLDSVEARPLFELLRAKRVTKAVHNLPVDAHTLANEGIELAGGINTLALSRYAWPHRARGEGFGLDALGRDYLGAGKMSEFSEIFSEETTEYRIRTRRVTECECGAKPCRKRSHNPGHRRIERIEETRIPRQVITPIPLESVVPGHPKWKAALAYSAQDAVLALGIYELATRELETRKVEVPWL